MTTMLDRVLNGSWTNPDTNEIWQSPIKEIHIKENLLSEIPQILSTLELNVPTGLIISDENTFKTGGETLSGALQLPHLDLPLGVNATEEWGDYIAEQAQNFGWILAVGSGTINDLCKYAAHKNNIPYIIFATAPSMNGYASKNASLISRSGLKESVSATLPLAIFMDVDILSQAPKRLIQSGIGDSISRTTAQADWLLSHYLLSTPYQQGPFDLLREDESYIHTNADKIVTGDKEAVTVLARLLILSGLGMTLAGSSAPASQGEHLIAHYMEMMNLDGGTHFHGEKIAITTLLMSKLQWDLIEHTTLQIDTPSPREDILREKFPASIIEDCLKAYKRKSFPEAHTDTLNDYLSTHWNSVRNKIMSSMVPSTVLFVTLEKAGIAMAPNDINWNVDDLASATAFSIFLRDRFTFLDLAFLAKA